MKSTTEYKNWLITLKSRIRQSQIKAAVKVNTELLRLYWDLGQDIVARQMETTWGSGFFQQLSNDLRKESPDMQGFSETNLKYAKRFYLFYSQKNQISQKPIEENKIPQQVAAELQVVENKEITIRQQVADEFSEHPIFQIPWRHQVHINFRRKDEYK